MSQFTIQLLVQLLFIALKALLSVSRTIGTVMDVVDDGVLNGSYEKPDWWYTLEKVLESLTIASSNVEVVRTKLMHPDVDE